MTEISVSIEDNVGLIHFERPDAGNVINLAFAQQLLAAARRCESDLMIRAVILTGEGKHFCLGGDLRAMSQAGNGVQEYLQELTTDLHSAIDCFVRMPVPVIASVNGTAAGAGLGLVAMADLAVAASSARFVAAYTGVALTPDGGNSFFLSQIIGRKRALELLYTNRVVSATEALAWGLVNRVVEKDVLAAARQLASSLAQGPRHAFASVKKLVGGADGLLRARLDLEGATIAMHASAPEGREGISAFLEKRKPSFI